MKNRKRILIGSVVVLSSLIAWNRSATAGSAAGAAALSEKELDRKVAQTLSKMTLEEKVGQMTQVSLEALTKGRNGLALPTQLDPEKMKTAFLKYHIGSVLNIVSDTQAFAPEWWVETINTLQRYILENDRAKVPLLYGIDSIHGATFVTGATLFPQSISVAASFNTELARKAAEISARETRAAAMPWNFFPVLDVARNPLWPRVWETYGEDTYLATKMGVATIEGLQGKNMASNERVAACMKHYIGYSMPVSGKDRTPAWIPERALREWLLPPFEAAIKAGAATIMVNSGEVDGVPGHANRHLLTDVLRKELGFKGLAVSDWEDVKRLHYRDHVAASYEDAVRLSVLAGLDMSMVPDDFSFAEILVKLVKAKKVPMKRIDEAAGRILRVKYQLGLFEHPYADPAWKSRIATPEAMQANLEAAREVLTLLKNEKNVLPLSKKMKVLVTGPTANSLSRMNGGWTITWQGNDENLYPKDKLTVLKAIQEKIGAENVIYEPGSSLDQAVDIPAAVRAAKEADAVVVCLGERAYTEMFGNIDDLSLEASQMKLARELISTGKPVVVVMIEGRPRVFTEVAEKAPAILMAYLPGMEGGRAIADVLFGDANPSGKLPFSYPRAVNSFVPYDHKYTEIFDGNAYAPLYPFGHGLSYTKFQYSDLKLSKEQLRKGESVKVSVTVANTGAVAGKEAVLLYLSDLYASVSRPVRQLRGFSKVALQPGEQKIVEFELKPEDLSFIGRDYKRIVEPGEFKVAIGGQERKFVLLDK